MIIPSISILKGNIVEVVNNNYKKVNTKFSELISKLKEYKVFYISDINGIEEGKLQLDFIKRNSLKNELWINGGVRYSENVIDILVAGASYVVIGTKTLVSLKELEKAFELTENIIFQIDYKNRIISYDLEVIKMSVKKLKERCREIGIGKIILADYGSIEKNQVNFDFINELISLNLEVYVSANKRFSYDLEKIGIKGTIVNFNEVIK